jgi:hypothetical protein
MRRAHTLGGAPPVVNVKQPRTSASSLCRFPKWHPDGCAQLREPPTPARRAAAATRSPAAAPVGPPGGDAPTTPGRRDDLEADASSGVSAKADAGGQSSPRENACAGTVHIDASGAEVDTARRRDPQPQAAPADTALSARKTEPGDERPPRGTRTHRATTRPRLVGEPGHRRAPLDGGFCVVTDAGRERFSKLCPFAIREANREVGISAEGLELTLGDVIGQRLAGAQPRGS